MLFSLVGLNGLLVVFFGLSQKSVYALLLIVLLSSDLGVLMGLVV